MDERKKAKTKQSNEEEEEKDAVHATLQRLQTARADGVFAQRQSGEPCVPLQRGGQVTHSFVIDVVVALMVVERRGVSFSTEMEKAIKKLAKG